MAALRGGAIVSINHSQSASASIPTGARVNLPRLHVLNKEPTRGRDAASSSPASLAGGTAKSSPAESSAYVPPHFVVLMEPPYVSTGPEGTQERAERAEFLLRLHMFMKERGTPVTRIPTLGHHELDLVALYRAVIGRGGVETVIANKGWRQIAEKLRLPSSCTDSGFRLRLHYLSYLYPYERRYFHGLDDDDIPPKLRPSRKGESKRVAEAATRWVEGHKRQRFGLPEGLQQPPQASPFRADPLGFAAAAAQMVNTMDPMVAAQLAQSALLQSSYGQVAAASAFGALAAAPSTAGMLMMPGAAQAAAAAAMASQQPYTDGRQQLLVPSGSSVDSSTSNASGCSDTSAVFSGNRGRKSSYGAPVMPPQVEQQLQQTQQLLALSQQPMSAAQLQHLLAAQTQMLAQPSAAAPVTFSAGAPPANQRHRVASATSAASSAPSLNFGLLSMNSLKRYQERYNVPGPIAATQHNILAQACSAHSSQQPPQSANLKEDDVLFNFFNAAFSAKQQNQQPLQPPQPTLQPSRPALQHAQI